MIGQFEHTVHITDGGLKSSRGMIQDTSVVEIRVQKDSFSTDLI